MGQANAADIKNSIAVDGKSSQINVHVLLFVFVAAFDVSFLSVSDGGSFK